MTIKDIFVRSGASTNILENPSIGRSGRKTALERAFDRHKRLLDAQKFSVLDGYVDIIFSTAPDLNSTVLPVAQKEQLRTKAYEFAEEIGDRARVFPANFLGMDMTFGDPAVSDVIVLGHGSINCLWTRYPEVYDWRRVSKRTKHLKLGRVTQLTCGNFPLPPGENVAMGTFAVADFSNVYAAPGEIIPDESIAELSLESTVRRVYDGGVDIIQQIQTYDKKFTAYQTACEQYPRPLKY